MCSDRLRRQGVKNIVMPWPVQEVHARLCRDPLLQLFRDEVVVVHPSHCRAHAAVQIQIQIHHPDGHLQVRSAV